VKVDVAGYLAGVRFIASPNCDERPLGCAVSLLVIHHISVPPDEFVGNGVIELFTNQLNPDVYHCHAAHDIKVSAHFFIRRNGEIIQFVPCGKRAWHAGVSCWQGKTRCNDFSIGVEIEGSDATPFTDSQYAVLVSLTIELRRAYPIIDITGHSDIASGRKTDPGPYFDWDRYRDALLTAKQN